jgi:hypothetical protein
MLYIVCIYIYIYIYILCICASLIFLSFSWRLRLSEFPEAIYVLQRLGATVSMYESLIFPRPGATTYMYEPHFLAKKKSVSPRSSLCFGISPLYNRGSKKKKAPKNKKRRWKTKRELSLFWNISPLHKSRLAKKKKAPSKQKEKVDSKYMKKEARVREKVIKKKIEACKGS